MKMTLTLEDKDLLGLSEGAMVALFRTIQAIANENNDNGAEPKKPIPTIKDNTSNESKTVNNEEEPKAKAKEVTTTTEEPKQRSCRKSNNTKKELKVEEPTEKIVTDEPITSEPEIKQSPIEDKKEEKPAMTMDELKHFCATNCKAHVGLSAKLRKVLTDEFKAEKLSSVKPDDYQALHDRVAELVEEM